MFKAKKACIEELDKGFVAALRLLLVVSQEEHKN